MKQENKMNYTGVGLIFGSAIGAGFGIAMQGNMALTAAMGAALGLVFGAMLSHNAKKNGWIKADQRCSEDSLVAKNTPIAWIRRWGCLR